VKPSPPSPRSADAIVVLGARVLEDGTPSSALTARTEHGARLYREGVAPLLLITGGSVGHPRPEAEVAAELARRFGVPDRALLLERQSRSTIENATLSAPLLRDRGAGRIALVTDPYHLFRATRCFWREGFEVLPAPTDLSLRNLRWNDRLYWLAREALSVLRRPALLLTRRPR
jgi:uncharacterized SAM-binding protein YcdF (DUF218 family)